MKKFFSLVLALVMALSLTTVAWGADPVTHEAADKTALTAALNTAADGDIIKLTANIDMGTDYAKVAKKLTLDLGQFIITSANTDMGTVYVGTAGDLTINATTGGVTNTVKNAIGNYGVLVVNGGTFTGDYALYNYYYNATTFGTATINGGTFQANSGDLAIANCGKLTVAGGDIETLDSSAELKVTGGSIEELAVTEPDYAPPVTETTISDGSVESLTVEAAVEDSIAVSGGSFASAVPAEYCAPGLVPVIENGTFTVGTAPAASGTTGNNSFSSSTTSGVTTSVSAAEKYAIYDAFSTTKVSDDTLYVKSYTTMATKTETVNGVTTTSYIPAYYTLSDGTKLYEADANSGLFRIFKGDQFVTYVNPLFNALSTGGYVDGDYIADSAAYIAKDKGCGTYGEDVYKINNDKAYAVDPVGRFVAVINGKVAVYDGARVSVPHTFTNEVTYKSTTDLTVVAIECDVCEKVFQVVKTTKLPATYKGATAPLFFGGNNYYILLETGATSGTTGTVGGTTTKPVQSAETFDAGIAMYVGMSVMAAAGSAVVLKKKD